MPAAKDSHEERRRIADVAHRLFYAEGVTATGVDRVSRAAGISKRTLYERFGSKDDLVTAALDVADEPAFRRFVVAAESVSTDPLQRLDGLFAAVETWAGEAGFRGCPFVNAVSELPAAGHPARRVAQRHKERLRGWIAEQARAGGVIDADGLSRALMVVADGALARCAVSGDAAPARVAREMAAALVRAAARDLRPAGARRSAPPTAAGPREPARAPRPPR